MLGPTHVLLAVTRKLGHFSAGELSQDSSWRGGGGAVRGGGGAVRDGGVAVGDGGGVVTPGPGPGSSTSASLTPAVWAVRLWGCDCTGDSTWLTS